MDDRNAREPSVLTAGSLRRVVTVDLGTGVVAPCPATGWAKDAGLGGRGYNSLALLGEPGRDYVRHLVVSGFKGFRDWNLLDLSPRVSVAVGDNGTGKSSLVEALLLRFGADLRGFRITHRRETLFQLPSDGQLDSQ